MAEYALYLESGPRRRKTMVHVLDLLGCTAQGPTTEAALEATPEAIRAYLRFLRRHGEATAAEPEDAFSTVIATHVMEGSWIGNGDPAMGFAPDFQPLSPDDLAVYVRRLGWLGADLLELIRDVPREQMAAEPEAGRPIDRILEHVAESQGAYLRGLVGKVENLREALNAVKQDPAALARVWQIAGARLEALTEEERTLSVQHGQVTWTARRGFRRMLEHGWEHLLEIAARLNKTV